MRGKTSNLKVVEPNDQRPDFDAFIKSCENSSATHTSGERFGRDAQAYVMHIEAKLRLAEESAKPQQVPMVPVELIDNQIAALQELKKAQHESASNVPVVAPAAEAVRQEGDLARDPDTNS